MFIAWTEEKLLAAGRLLVGELRDVARYVVLFLAFTGGLCWVRDAVELMGPDLPKLTIDQALRQAAWPAIVYTMAVQLVSRYRKNRQARHTS